MLFSQVHKTHMKLRFPKVNLDMTRHNPVKGKTEPGASAPQSQKCTNTKLSQLDCETKCAALPNFEYFVPWGADEELGFHFPSHVACLQSTCIMSTNVKSDSDVQNVPWIDFWRNQSAKVNFKPIFTLVTDSQCGEFKIMFWGMSFQAYLMNTASANCFQGSITQFHTKDL